MGIVSREGGGVESVAKRTMQAKLDSTPQPMMRNPLRKAEDNAMSNQKERLRLAAERRRNFDRGYLNGESIRTSVANNFASNSFVIENLTDGEVVKHYSRVHIFVYAQFVLCAFLSIVALFHFLLSGKGSSFLVLFLIMISAILFVSSWIKRSATELVVTNKRVVAKYGFIQRRSVEISLTKIESVDIDQGVIGRIFDYGTVVIRGTGGGLSPMPSIESPILFRNAVVNQT